MILDMYGPAPAMNFATLPGRIQRHTTGMWSHIATIGEGRKKVHCTFDMSSDGEVENLEVSDGAINVTPYLAYHQIEELESECWDAYVKQADEHNTDMAISRRES